MAANQTVLICINPGVTRTLHRLAAAVAVLPLTVVTPVLVASSSSATVGAAAKPTAQPTAKFEKGVLTVHGTKQGQTMTVSRKGRKVTVRVGGARVALPKSYTNRKCDEIRIVGLAGNDQMTVDSSKGRVPDVVLVGGKGDDVLTGGTRSDVLDGGQGNDVLRPGDGGSDVLDGGIGADTYLVDADLPGQATIVEPDADGPDHLSFAATSGALTVDLGSKASQQVSSAYTVVLPHLGIEDLTGGEGSDTLLGGESANVVHGGPGNDLLQPNRGMGAGPDTGNVLAGDAGDDTFELFVACNACGSTRLEDSSGSDTVSFVGSGGSLTTRLDTTAWQTIAYSYQLQLGSITAIDNVIGGGKDHITGNDVPNRLNGWYGDDTLTGKGGADTFVIGGPFPGLGAWGADTVTDFAGGIDLVDLDPGLSVESGLGTATVTIWDGTTDLGSITASNGHLWTGPDFT